MRNFAAELDPGSNGPLLEAWSVAQWVAKTHRTLVEALRAGSYGGPLAERGSACAEYRLALGIIDYDFRLRETYYRRLEWRFMADGWNAVRAVQPPHTGEVLLRLFALHEPLLVVPEPGTPFPVQLQAPFRMDDDLPAFNLEDLARSVARHGAWRYDEASREFVPPHRILGVRHVYARDDES